MKINLIWSLCIAAATGLIVPMESHAQTCHTDITLSRYRAFHRGLLNANSFNSRMFYEYGLSPINCENDSGQIVSLSNLVAWYSNDMEREERSPYNHTVSRLYFNYEGKPYSFDFPEGTSMVDVEKNYIESPTSKISKALPKGTAFDPYKMTITGFDFGSKAPPGIRKGKWNPTADKKRAEMKCSFLDKTGFQRFNTDFKAKIENPCGRELYLRKLNCIDELGINFSIMSACGTNDDSDEKAKDCFLSSEAQVPSPLPKEGAATR